MIKAGVFGNAYFGSCKDDTKYLLGKVRKSMLPHEWFEGIELFDKPKWSTALFAKKASMSRDWWLDRQLIADCDPLGWFEWYCWYYLGRRLPKEDQRQIDRWASYRKRQSAMLEARPTAVGLQQALFHWSVDPWIV